MNLSPRRNGFTLSVPGLAVRTYKLHAIYLLLGHIDTVVSHFFGRVEIHGTVHFLSVFSSNAPVTPVWPPHRWPFRHTGEAAAGAPHRGDAREHPTLGEGEGHRREREGPAVGVDEQRERGRTDVTSDRIDCP